MMSREEMVKECSWITGQLTDIYPAQVDKVFFENLTHEELIREFLLLARQFDKAVEEMKLGLRAINEM